MSNKKEDTPAFMLHNTNTDFNKKSDSLFGCLQTLEDKHKAFEKARAGNSSSSEDDEYGLLKKDPSEEETETITSAFKNPGDISSCPPRHRSGSHQNGGHRSGNRYIRGKRPYVPDFRDQPQKWTKYSLEDVDEMNESSNKGAAFAFLEERRNLREAADKIDKEDSDIKIGDQACSKGLITFKRPDKSVKIMKDSESTSLKSDKNDDVSEICKSDKVKYDVGSDELKDSGVDFPIDENDVQENITKSESQTTTVTVFKSHRNRNHRNIRKKESSSEEED